MIVSDNSTSFSSQEFRSWCEERGISLIMGSPYHPATNGLAERFVQTFKRALQKSMKGPDDALIEFLLQYRRTPGPDGFSPSERLNGRQIRTYIDIYHPLQQKVQTKSGILPKHYRFVVRGGACYFKNEVRKSDRSPRWIPATICEVLGNRHVLVKVMSSGRKLKKHFDQLRPRYPKKEDTDFPLYLPTWNTPVKQQGVEPPKESEQNERPLPRRSTRIRRPPTQYQPTPWPRKFRKFKRGRC
ncbi:hypothetical protein RF11_15161 [Thelohanellus kitauei]|uniref:Integrase catalytic domain-containing protein n=1 Tax=Thelohanellus kitauei TaxID=669202 RepID=A0A0C2MV49_THEKT|nr:hypothetical protein RF11_15161 [Thelohanellus kitauei]